MLPFFAFMTYLIAVPDRREVLQLGRHDVAGLAELRHTDAVVRRLPGDVPLRWSDRRAARLAADRLPRRRTRTSSSRTSTTCCSAPWSSRCSPASTSGGRSGPARCSTSGSARSTSGRCSSASTPRSWCSTGSAPRACRVVTRRTCASNDFTTLNTISTIGSYLLGAVDVPVPVQRVQDGEVRQARHRGRPVGLGPLAGVGDLLPAAAAQLQLAAPGPLRVPGLRPAPPRGGADGDRERRARALREEGADEGARGAGRRGQGRAPGREEGSRRRQAVRPEVRRGVIVR